MKPTFAKGRALVLRTSPCRNLVLCCVAGACLLAAKGHAAPAPDPAGSSSSAKPQAVDAGGAGASFDRSMLSGGGQHTDDLARFEHDAPIAPGSYNVDVNLNGAWVSRRDVRFSVAPGHTDATACIDRSLLRQLGLGEAPAAVAAPAADHPSTVASDTCLDLPRLYPGTTVTFDQSNLRLDISVPQAWLARAARGYVDPRDWDAGVPAALLNYQFSTFHTNSGGASLGSSFLGLNTGLNIGAWHWRQDSSLTAQTGNAGNSHHWQNIASYVQRDLPAWRAQLTIGDSFTSGDLFDSIGLRGVRLATDDRMLPDSRRGYAPTVRGVAASNAKVSVSQNGVVIYQTTVAPGPFVISDLFPTGYGGDLLVSITEADGRVRTFTVPYASLPQLLRPGVTRFELAAGQVREQALPDSPKVAQATVQHGFNDLVTGYAGAAGTQGYGAALLGSALNTPYGALALEVTTARADIPGYPTQSGQAVQLSFSKILPRTDTAITVSAYRYDSSGYLGLRDAVEARGLARRGLPVFATGAGTTAPVSELIPGVSVPDGVLTTTAPGTTDTALDRPRDRLDLNLNQQLGSRGGSLYATLSARDYWNRRGTDTQYQLGYNNLYRQLSYSISAARVRDPLGRSDNQFFVSVTIPLGEGAHAPSLGGNVTLDQHGETLTQALLSGSAGTDNQFSYGTTASRSSGDAESAVSVDGSYRSPYGQFSASYGHGHGYTQYSAAATGVVVAHAGGVLFGQAAGDTMAIVSARDAAGARISNASGVRIDRSGYALVPYLTPYSRNTIELDPSGVPLNVQLAATSETVAPYAGAVVLVKFATSSARSVIVNARLGDGSAAPFGAEVFDEQQHSLGVVGQGGRALLRGVKDAGRLTIRWNDGGGAHACAFDYKLDRQAAQRAATSYSQVNATCVATDAGAPGSRSNP